jgi:hypothetical protein
MDVSVLVESTSLQVCMDGQMGAILISWYGIATSHLFTVICCALESTYHFMVYRTGFEQAQAAR